MGLWPTQGDEKSLRPATTLYRTVAPSFVIPSEAEGSSVLRTLPGGVSSEQAEKCAAYLFAKLSILPRSPSHARSASA
jgi:hypothetical protein